MKKLDKRLAKPMQHAVRSRGFTIAELVVALVIAALVLVAVTTAVGRIGRTREIARSRLASHQRAVDAIESLRRDIASTIRADDLFVCRLAITEGSIRTLIGEFDRSELLLFSSRLDPIREVLYNGEGIEYETQYRVMEDHAGSALWRRRDPMPDDTPEGGGLAEPIADGVLGVLFEAYDGESWWSRWDSDEDGLPLAVRATIATTGVGAGEDAGRVPEQIVLLRTVVSIDRAPAPRDEEAINLAMQEAATLAAANAPPTDTPTPVSIREAPRESAISASQVAPTGASGRAEGAARVEGHGGSGRGGRAAPGGGRGAGGGGGAGGGRGGGGGGGAGGTGAR